MGRADAELLRHAVSRDIGAPEEQGRRPTHNQVLVLANVHAGTQIDVSFVQRFVGVRKVVLGGKRVAVQHQQHGAGRDRTRKEDGDEPEGTDDGGDEQLLSQAGLKRNITAARHGREPAGRPAKGPRVLCALGWRRAPR